jgi:predicted lipid-binding transport protein (Tim44 family)
MMGNAALLRQGLGPTVGAVEIVILAMIAAFLGLRLYSVLGRRAEHEEEPIQGRIEPKLDAAPRAVLPPLGDRERERAPSQPAPRAMVPGVTPAIERGLREISAADRRFDLLSFVDGAKSAYGMVLEAFWRGDKDELGQLCDRDVFEGFVAAIDARTAAGETLDNRLIRIEDATVVAASYSAPMARIAVRFTADIAAVTRDKDGTVIAGSLDDAIETRDLWTFSRDTSSAGPDWLLDETDEA